MIACVVLDLVICVSVGLLYIFVDSAGFCILSTNQEIGWEVSPK